MNSIITNIIGYTASICMVLGYLPQTIHTLRTRKTDDIAVGTFLLMGLGGLFFCIQGLLLENWPLFLCNLLTTTMSAIIIRHQNAQRPLQKKKITFQKFDVRC